MNSVSKPVPHSEYMPPPLPLKKSQTEELDKPSDENNDCKDMEVENQDPEFF